VEDGKPHGSRGDVTRDTRTEIASKTFWTAPVFAGGRVRLVPMPGWDKTSSSQLMLTVSMPRGYRGRLEKADISILALQWVSQKPGVECSPGDPRPRANC